MDNRTEYDELAYIYDWEWKELTQDLDFLIEYAQNSNDDVLELACGTGRVFIPMAKAGINIWGIDNSREMLKIADKNIKELSPEVKNRIHISYGDMKNFDLAKKFGLIIIPFNSFLLLTKKEEQESCLECVYNHLKDGGLFIVDIYSPNFKLIAETNKKMNFLRHFYVPPIKKVVIQWEYLQRDMSNQIANSDLLYEMYDEQGNLSRKTSHLTMKIVFRYEMEHLLEKCGFEILNLFGDYDKSNFGSGSHQMIFICKKGIDN